MKAEPPILRQLFILMLRGGHLIQKSFIFSIYRIRSLDPLDLEEVSRAQCKFKVLQFFKAEISQFIFLTGFVAGGIFVNLAAKKFMQSNIDFESNIIAGNSILVVQDVFEARNGTVLNLLNLPSPTLNETQKER